ncbi:MAG: hypothetical protein KBD63_07225, partial [Bacteriovoracaceae bacterium]|nr:hypothetical protein [Bacteriovoracaceae bacterium]
MKYQKSFFLLFLILISGKNFLYAADSTCLKKQLALFTVQENDYVYLNFNIGGVPTPPHWHLRYFVTPQRIIDHRILVGG